MFDSGTGLTAIPFMSSIQMTPQNDPDGTLSNETDILFATYAQILGNTINITLMALDEVRIAKFSGIVLLYNTTKIK